MEGGKPKLTILKASPDIEINGDTLVLKTATAGQPVVATAHSYTEQKTAAIAGITIGNGDDIIADGEVSNNTISVKVTLPEGTKAGDKVVVTAGGQTLEKNSKQS